MLFPRTMLILGPGSTHLVTAANLWPLYDHTESCVAMINSALIALLIHGFSLVNARLLITYDTAFYAIIDVNKDTDYIEKCWDLEQSNNHVS